MNTGHTSEIHVEGGLVIKRVRDCLEFGVVEREAYWLNRMHDEPRTPVLIERDDNILKMTYVGAPLRRENAPSDLKRQLKDILKMLKRHKCEHHDINPDNLLVKDGYVSLIDFQWALAKGEKVPAEWPYCLNILYRVADGVHDDKHSVRRVLKEMGF